MPSNTEDDAKAFVAAALKPYCAKLVPEPELPNGTKPDFGFRLTQNPDQAFTIECKRFEHGDALGDCASGIAQASDYANCINRVSFVAPFELEKPMNAHAERSRVVGATVVAGQFSVGALAFSSYDPENTTIYLSVGGVIAVKMYRDQYGNRVTDYRTNSKPLLTFKQRRGSKTWRK